MKIRYDSQYDVLYCNLVDNANDYSASTDGSVETFRDVDTDEVTGYVIYDFKEWLNETIKETSESNVNHKSRL